VTSTALRRAAFTAALLACACSHRSNEARLSAEEENLQRRVRGLTAMLRELDANGGRLLRIEHVLVVVRQRLIQQVLDAGLPYERLVADRYRVRVAAARVLLEDGFATLDLDGRASLEDGSGAAAEIAVHGGLDVVDLDPASGVLRGRVKVYAVEAKRTQVMGVDVPAERLVEDLSKEKVEAFETLASSIEIPVRVASEVELPGIGPEGGVTIRPERIPVGAVIHDVKSFHHRLWISIRTSGVAVPGAK
jgi:hypothetical protein